MGSAIAPVLWPEIDSSSESSLATRTTRQLGAFYTPSVAAAFMARWAVRSGSERVIEPSMGDGQFLRAVASQAARAGHRGIEMWGVEIDQFTYRSTVGGGVLNPERAILGDFLAVTPFPVDVAIGNPPYVRLRHLPQQAGDQARQLASQSLGTSMDPAGSVWLPFVTHATRFLEPGGRLAFVLPFDATYVRYAKPLWGFLGKHYGDLRIIRVQERLFPEILQDVVLLLADRRGAKTAIVRFECFDRRVDLLDGEPSIQAQIGLDRVMGEGRPFLEALLPTDLRSLLEGKLWSMTRPMSAAVTWNIGYVAGDKAFFHPDAKTRSEFALPDTSLVPALSSGRRTAKQGLHTAGFRPASTSRLFLPQTDQNQLTAAEQAYIEHGRVRGVDQRYKCRIRYPWYVTPGVKIPDLIMPVFVDRPVLLINDGEYRVSNSMLAGYLKAGSAAAVTAAWYSSLTLLQIELMVHSLGGGVLVMVPREAGSIRTPIAASPDVLEDVDNNVRAGNIQQAYRSGDVATLQGVHGLTSREVDLIREGTDVLQRWRRATTTTL